MKLKIWLRILLTITGVGLISAMLARGNIITKRLYVSADSTINLQTLGEQLYLVEPEWQISESATQLIYSTEFNIFTTQQFSGIYVPRAEDAELFINHSNVKTIREKEHLVYLFEPMDEPQTVLLEIHLPALSHEMYNSAQFYMGSYDSILSASFRESNLRLFIIGISFTIILFSVSLFFHKRTEKYLLPLAILAYTTFGYILLRAFPALEENVFISILLLGPFKIPFLSSQVSRLLYRMYFPLLVSFLTFLVLKNFVSVKIFKIDYFYFILPFSVILLFFIGTYHYSYLVLLFRFFINLLECIVIIKGEPENKNDSITLMVGAIGTMGLNIFIASSSINLIPNGDADLLFRLGGLYALVYPIVFTIAINGIFARKYTEAEVLLNQLNDLNQNLQLIVDDRTSELKSAYLSLEKEQKQKDIFITNMVHSLKTPLFSIAGFADMAKEAFDSRPERVKHFIQLIETNTDFVVKLMNNLFLALRLEYKKINYMIKKVNLCIMIQQIKDTTLPQANAKKIHIKLDVPECPILVDCDIYYLTLAIQNIVDNAVRHTPEGGEIRIGIIDLGENIRISVSDNGEGIPENVINYIFERYYSHSSHGHESSGLGLSISKDVISALHGEIDVYSSRGEGTEFLIHLPKILTSQELT